MRAAAVALLLLSQSAVLLAILRRSLLRPYIFFFIYILALILRQSRLSFLSPRATDYLEFWALTLVFIIPLQILAAGESAYRSLEQFRGLRTSVFIGAGAVAVVVAVWIQDLLSHQTRFGTFSQADQAVTTTLFLGGLAFTLGLSWIHPQRRRNARVHELLLLWHFGLLAGALFLLHRGHYEWVGPCCTLLSSGGFFAWAFLIRREGEQLKPVPASLPSLNTLLLGAWAGVLGMCKIRPQC